MNYEINFLILQSQTENIAKIRNKVKELIKKNKGTVTDELSYQKRKLAYEIKHEQYGFYTVYRFDIEDSEKLKDLTKNLNLKKSIARHIIVKSDEIPELQKEIGKAPKTEEERKAEAIKNAPKRKVGKKILDEISKETTKQVETKPAPKKEKQKEVKEEVKKKAKKETEKGKEKETKKAKISMDDLDKKLDEILNI